MAIIRYVKKSDDGGWDVVKDGHRRATAHGSTKHAAVELARELTRQEGGGEVAVINRTGKVVEADTVRAPSRRAAA